MWQLVGDGQRALLEWLFQKSIRCQPEAIIQIRLSGYIPQLGVRAGFGRAHCL
jgi:hypothetical protein